jgi:3-oxoacyl-[acyl-carrier-protein] synthase III
MALSKSFLPVRGAGERSPIVDTGAGLVSIGGYLPAKRISPELKKRLVSFLKTDTLLPPEFIEQIDATGRLPGTVETNEAGWEKQPWFDHWVKNLPPKKRADPFQGTKERRRVPTDPVSLKESIIPHPMMPSDAETLAGAMAIINSGIDKDRIDLVLSFSQVPDFPLPSNASLIQHKLTLSDTGAYAVDSCCSSFLTMMELACGLVKSGVREAVLIVCSYIDSHVVDRSAYYGVYTGDAAVGAIVTRTTQGSGYIASSSTSYGSRHDGIIFERRRPKLFKKTNWGPDSTQEFTTFYNLRACKEIAANTDRDMVEVVHKVLVKADLTIGAVDFLVTHQPVPWAGNSWREALKIPVEKAYESFKKYGNIATCSAPVNLLEAIEKKLISAGDIVLMASSGAGENYIAVLQRVSSRLIQNIHAFL